MKFIISDEIKGKIPGVEVVLLPVSSVEVHKSEVSIKRELEDKIKKLKDKTFFDDDMFVAYRKLYEDLGFDPKENLPSVESLYKRYLSAKKFPQINNVVDATNLVALKTLVPLGVSDVSTLKGNIALRFSQEGEKFEPLGGGVETLSEGFVVMADDEKILSKFFYRDSIHQKITDKTKDILVLGCKVESIEKDVVEQAVRQAGLQIEKVAGGKVGNLFYSSVGDVSLHKKSARDKEMIRKIRSILDKKKIKYKILDSGTASLKLEDQIKALNMKFREGLGTLLYKTDDGRYVALFRRDDRSVDTKKLKQILKTDKIDIAEERDLKKLGFEQGLLTPFLFDDTRIDIIVDQAVLDMTRIITGAATPNHAIELQKEDFFKFLKDLKCRELDVTFPNPHRQDADNIQVKTVLSGITPSGNALHIGNYFGAVKPQMDMQDSVENSFYFVADLHALTTVQDKKNLEENVVNNVLDFIALGLDPKKSAYFRQSDVPAHCQLAIVLANYIPFGFLKRMHAFKDKLAKGATHEQINMGLFNYPILMAADILLYKPEGVPVGEDQRQHVELTRDIAERFNGTYPKEFFPLPEPLIQGGHAAKVVGTDGDRKMSKSLGNVVGIFEEEKVIREQIMSCYTDPNRKKVTDPGTVEGNPVFVFHDLMNDNKDEVDDLKKRYREGKVGDVEVKEKLFEAHKRTFSEARKKRKEIEGDISLAKDILEQGAAKAVKVADKTLEEVYDIIGIKNDLSVLFNK